MLFIMVFGVEVFWDLVYVKVFIMFYENDEEVVKSYMKLFIENIVFLCGLLVKCICMCLVFYLYFFEDKLIIEGMCILNLVSEIIVCDKVC